MNKRIQVSFFSTLLAIVVAALFVACGNTTSTARIGGSVVGTTASNNGIKATTTSNSGLKATNTSASSVPLKVTSVDMSLNPPTLRNITCGTTIKETYTAVFHFPTNNAGGPVKFEYTVNNGRASRVEGLTVHPGQTSATYTFSWSGPLDPSSTVPGRGGVLVTAPNAYISNLVAPSGPCRPAPVSPVPFKVTSIGLVASPEVTGHRCGTSFTENYIATFHIAAGGPGGTIVFRTTTNNGRAAGLLVSLPVAAGQTSAIYVFKWSGVLPQDHTAPGIGIVMVSAPNQMISPSAIPAGGCNNM